MMDMKGIEGHILAGRGPDGSSAGASRLSSVFAIHSRNDQNTPIDTLHPNHRPDAGGIDVSSQHVRRTSVTWYC